MREPRSVEAVVLIDAVARLRFAAASLPDPPVVLGGWASPAALEYEAAATRIAVGLLHLRSALDDAAAALVAP